MESGITSGRPPRRSAGAAATIFWSGFYGLQVAGAYLVIVVANEGTASSYPSPAFFLPLLPVGIFAIVGGCLLAMDYQGVRAVFKRSVWVRMMDAMSFWHDAAGPYSAGLMILIGTGALIGGVVAAVYLAG